MIKNRDQIDEAGRAFYWRRKPNANIVIAESTRPDIVIGYREGYEQALRDIKAALEPQESPISPTKNKSVWQTIKERELGSDPLLEAFLADDIVREEEKSPETVAYEQGWMDGYDEGLYDGMYK